MITAFVRACICAVLLLQAAPSVAADLAALISRGVVSVEDIRGTGSSSGASVTAVLVNNSDAAVRIDVGLAEPVFMRNRGAAQNMIAVAVYGRDGSYNQAGRDGAPFIEVPRNGRLSVTFVAYCADFEKENPSASDGFSVTSVPPELTVVAAAIRDYERLNFNADNTRAMQFLLWRAQGVRAEDIQQKFPVTPEDERVVEKILQAL